MFAILAIIITTAYLLQTWGIEYGDPVYSVIMLLACIPAALADYQVLKEIMREA